MGLFNNRELQELRNKVEELESMIENYKANESSLKNDIRDYKAEIRNKEKEIKDLFDKNSELLIQLEREARINKNNITSYETTINIYRREVKTTKDKFNELVKSVEEYREDVEKEIEEYKNQIKQYKGKCETIEEMEKEIGRRQEIVNTLKKEGKQLEENNKIKNIELENYEITIEKSRTSIEELRKEIEELEERKEGMTLLEEINMVVNPYSYETSQEFQEQLEIIKKQQKEMVREGRALVFSTTWEVSGSKVKGRKFMKDLTKLGLMSFNNECDNIIMGVKYSSMGTAQTKIEKAFNNVNKFIKTINSNITDEYLQLKIKELQLKCGWLKKKEEEKEELKRQAEILREQERLEKEIEEAKEKIQYEQTQYSTEIKRLEEQLKNEQGNNDIIMKQLAKLQDKLAKLEEKKKDVLNRQINKKAGWVYIISNDSFEGKEVYKIGVTRALDYNDRLSQLSSASVPFKFKVNSVIFSEDAFALETALHRAFSDKRWNKANFHKEFFLVSLDEIKAEVLKHNPTATFIYNPIDEEYVKTMAMQ